MYSVFTQADDGHLELALFFFFGGEYGWGEDFFLSSSETEITCSEKELFITAGWLTSFN